MFSGSSSIIKISKVQHYLWNYLYNEGHCAAYYLLKLNAVKNKGYIEWNLQLIHSYYTTVNIPSPNQTEEKNS